MATFRNYPFHWSKRVWLISKGGEMVKVSITHDLRTYLVYKNLNYRIWTDLKSQNLYLMSRKWLVKYHPDKWHGLCEGEKEVASFIIKEYRHVFQHSNKVMVMDKAMHQARIFWGEVWTHPEMICTPRGIWHHPQKFLHPANYIYFDLIVSYLIISYY
jgi:hypothetical protein